MSSKQHTSTSVSQASFAGCEIAGDFSWGDGMAQAQPPFAKASTVPTTVPNSHNTPNTAMAGTKLRPAVPDYHGAARVIIVEGFAKRGPPIGGMH
jgi:hypothetical protein